MAHPFFTLRELEGQFLKYAPYPDKWIELRNGVEVPVEGIRKAFKHVDTLAEADGVSFVCPICLVANGMNRVGVHSCICWFKGHVPDDLHPLPGRWIPTLQSTDMDNLTFGPPGAFSVGLPCGHGYIESGGFSIR